MRQVDIQINDTRAALFPAVDAFDHELGPGKWTKDLLQTEKDWMISESWFNRPPTSQTPVYTFQIAPYIYVYRYQNDGADYGEALTFDYTADFTWDEIKKITEIRCSIVDNQGYSSAVANPSEANSVTVPAALQETLTKAENASSQIKAAQEKASVPRTPLQLPQ